MGTMTPTERGRRTSVPEDSMHRALLPRWAPFAMLAVAVVVGILLGGSKTGAFVLALLVYLGGIYTASRVVEDRRKATDRLVTGLVGGAFLVALLPLVGVTYTVVSNGYGVLSPTFFTASTRNVIGEGGGIYHAIIGTLIVTGLTMLMSVPVGILAAIYLVEYGKGALARQITFFVDVMTGIPSIVAGLFAYALFALLFGPGIRFGIGGAVALSVLMIPVVVRSTEEMLKLVPNELREAAYALGVPKWRTITKVVLPTAAAGIATGVMLSIARVIGETAPLLVITGSTDTTNVNPFAGRMMTLPVFTFSSYSEPGVPPEFSIDRAWGAALVLMMIVLILNLIGRAISHFLSPKAKG